MDTSLFDRKNPSPAAARLQLSCSTQVESSLASSCIRCLLPERPPSSTSRTTHAGRMTSLLPCRSREQPTGLRCSLCFSLGSRNPHRLDVLASSSLFDSFDVNKKKNRKPSHLPVADLSNPQRPLRSTQELQPTPLCAPSLSPCSLDVPSSLPIAVTGMLNRSPSAPLDSTRTETTLLISLQHTYRIQASTTLKDGRIHALYSTPSIYTDAKYAANESWPLKTGDYFPYADWHYSYWTGYYTSRPAFKRFVRALSGYYLAARQIEFLVGRKSSGPVTSILGNALGIAQHHDAVSGTSKQHTTNDYAKRLAYGASQAEMVINLAIPCLTKPGKKCASDSPSIKLSQCNLLNISYCPATEEFSKGKSLVMVVYNSLGWNRTEFVRIPIDLLVQQSYLWYGSNKGDDENKQASGAYIFRPNGTTPSAASRSVTLKVLRGPVVDEVHQQFNSWIYQVTRIYKDKESAEFEFSIGPIPTDDCVGKEVITRLTTNMVTNKTFYTDSNGRDFLKRVRDYREDWDLNVTQPIAGNYYPLNLGMYMADGKYELSVLVDSACGGSSIQDGQLEIMLHRRLLADDGRGVSEALDEKVCTDDGCEGLTARGKYYMSVNKLVNGANWRRTNGQQIYSPVLLAFTHEDANIWKSSQITKATSMDPSYSLPPNVALITLEELDDGTVLLRLAHLYEADEDVQNSVLAKVELKKIFSTKTIKEVEETSLSANQKKSEMKKKNWRVEGDSTSQPIPLRGGPLNNSTLIVELGPMEIRTFLLKF